jgi:Fe-S-cluster containining protein
MGFYEENANHIFEEIKNKFPEFQEIYEKHGSLEVVNYAHQYIDAYLEKSKLFEKASCKGLGCSFCCHSVIYGSEIEMDYIKHNIKLLKIKPNKRRSKLQNSVKDESKLKWVDKACPYLTDDKKCSIYEFRPIVCRTHNSTENPDNCNKEDENGYEKQLTIGELRMIVTEAVTVILNLLTSDTIKLKPIHKVF